MDFDKLKAYMAPFQEKANVAIHKMRPLTCIGIAVPLPPDATPEAKEQMDAELTRQCWSFQRCQIGRNEYYVLFPLGQ